MKQSDIIAAPTCDLNDANEGKVSQVMLPFFDYGKRTMFAGRIRTFTTMEDTQAVREALYNTPGDGAVIVLDGGGSMRAALLGDMNADLLHKNGWAGIVINGAIRDSAEIAKIDIGVKALGLTPVRSPKKGIGAADVPVAFGNVLFETGQCIYCDRDGVLVSEMPIFV